MGHAHRLQPSCYFRRSISLLLTSRKNGLSILQIQLKQVTVLVPTESGEGLDAHQNEDPKLKVEREDCRNEP